MEKEYDICVFIGRFQPFHNQHLEVLKQALQISEKVLVIIGSYNASPNIKNPFTYAERVEMIKSSMGNSPDLYRVEFIPVRDYYYNDNLWCAEIQQKTAKFIDENHQVAIIGSYKDSSSYYLNLFPQWEFVPAKQKASLNATDIRNLLYDRNKQVMDFNIYHPDETYKSLSNDVFDQICEMVPSQVIDWMIQKYFNTERYSHHVQEHFYIKDYKAQWSKAPYPPTFVTTDCVVVCNGHVLVVKRKFNPGKGLYALPGGFLKQSEKLEDCAVRELKEETGIKLHKNMLRDNITESKVFDYPGRSLRGRTITHAYYIQLKDRSLPEIKAASDAETVQWVPIADIFHNEARFFEDHFHVIQYFLTRG